MLLNIGLVVVTLGIIGFIWGIFQKLKAGRVADAPLAATGDVVQKGAAACGPKGQISSQGGVVCPQPLIAPFSGTPCLYYRIKCTAEWKDGDNHKSKVLDEQKVAAAFAIDDGTGPVGIDAHEGGDFEPTQTKRETKGTGLLGGLTGTELTFGSYRVQTGMLALGTKYSVEEEVLPVVARIYACGKLADRGGMIGAPGWRQLILSAKSREELLASATKGAKIFLSAGAVAFVVGSGMAVAGQMIGATEQPKVAPSASVVTKDTPPAPVSAAPPAASPLTTTTTTTSAPLKASSSSPLAAAKGSAAASSKPGGKPDAGAPKTAPSAKK